MKLGFTGTRMGMSREQKVSFDALLFELQPTEFHHGGCVGADAQAHEIVRHRLPECRIVIHPTRPGPHRASELVADELRDEAPPLDRNRTIVDSVEHMAAAPLGDQEVLRSGTWATIRYARKHCPLKVLGR